MKLHLRIETEIGPRTVVMSRMDEREARAIAAAFERLGQGTFVTEDGRVVDMAARLKRHRAVKARKAALRLASFRDMPRIVRLPQRVNA